MKRARYSRPHTIHADPRASTSARSVTPDAKGPGWPVRSGPLVSGPRAAGSATISVASRLRHYGDE
jgi:hypothetical protein